MMFKEAIVLLSIIAALPLLLCYTQETAYPFSKEVVLVGKFPKSVSIFWRVDTDKKLAFFKLQFTLLPGEWLIFGFSDHGNYENSDAFVISHISNKITLVDGQITNDGDIVEDAEQNFFIKDLSFSESGIVTAEFARPFMTCDKNDYIIDNSTTQLIVAVGLVELMNINLASVSKSIYPTIIVRNVVDQELIDPDTWIMDVSVSQVPLPAEDTVYWCQTRKLPEFPKKIHIIGFEAMIQPGNEQVVHHMEVYLCDGNGNPEPPWFSGTCNPENLPPVIKGCKWVLGAWAIGAETFMYPLQAGTALGGPSFYPYVMVEIHYTNLAKRPDIVDNSGIRFFVTPNVRQFDAGILEVGLIYNDRMGIPPGQSDFELTGHCLGMCTRSEIPPEGIFVFGSQLHAHLTGRKLSTKLLRNGEELQFVNKDDHYSPHWQIIRLLKDPVRVYANDALVTTCSHNTKDRKSATVGGFGIYNEMCVNYLHYYPKVNLEVCKSSISRNSLDAYFDSLREYGLSNTQKGASDTANYQAVNWTPDAIYALKTHYKLGNITQQCLNSNGDYVFGEWGEIRIPPVIKSLKDVGQQCVPANWQTQSKSRTFGILLDGV